MKWSMKQKGKEETKNTLIIVEWKGTILKALSVTEDNTKMNLKNRLWIIELGEATFQWQTFVIPGMNFPFRNNRKLIGKLNNYTSYNCEGRLCNVTSMKLYVECKIITWQPCEIESDTYFEFFSASDYKGICMFMSSFHNK